MKKYQLPSLLIGLSLVIIPVLTYGQVQTIYREDGPRPMMASSTQPRPMPPRGPFMNSSTTRPFMGSTTPRMMPPDGRPFASSTASTTRWEMQNDIRAQIDQKRNELRDLNQGSSTNRNGMPPGRSGDRKELRIDIFKIQQDNIVRQLNRALDNLKQVRGRIQERITKAEQNGKDMTSTKALLVIADDKIAIASTSVNSFATYKPTDASSTVPNIQLEKPRQVGAAAIASIKVAKDALNDVVVSLAHVLGINLDQKLGQGPERDRDQGPASSTPPQIPGNPPVACTQDARMCPDGSYVSRRGPRCEFAACPGVEATTTPPCQKATIMGPNGPVEVCNDLQPGQVY